MAQTQTPNIFRKAGALKNYYPAADVFAGDIVVIGNTVLLAPNDIAASATSTLGLLGVTIGGALHTTGLWDVNKDASTFSDGDAVYWNATGNPTIGTAGTGCATSTASGNKLIGPATAAAATGDQYVSVMSGAPMKGSNLATATVAAAGSIQGDAAAITEGFTLVTAADATKGVKLPTAVAGLVCIVKNSDTANAVLKIWPFLGDGINAIAVNSAFSIAAKTSVMLVAYDATTWYSLPLLPS